MYILGSYNILFYFNLLINIYAGVFVGDSFCPKGVVLLGGQHTYIHTYFIVTSPKGFFRNNDYITLFIITNYNT